LTSNIDATRADIDLAIFLGLECTNSKADIMNLTRIRMMIPTGKPQLPHDWSVKLQPHSISQSKLVCCRLITAFESRIRIVLRAQRISIQLVQAFPRHIRFDISLIDLFEASDGGHHISKDSKM
jgi:hypothetical protein